MGLVFDGDCDRIAAIDGQGNFCSTQILIPVLIEHLAQRKGMKGEIVKTVSGSDLIPKIAQFMNIPISETAIGYKYIAERMLQNQVLVGEKNQEEWVTVTTSPKGMLCYLLYMSLKQW